MKTKRKQEQFCRWKYDDHLDYYATECNHGHNFRQGDIAQNMFAYCPYCGRRIKEAK